MANFTKESKLKDVVAVEGAWDIIEEYLPGISKNPGLPMVKGFALEKLTKIQQVGMSEDMLEAILEDINSKLP